MAKKKISLGALFVTKIAMNKKHHQRYSGDVFCSNISFPLQFDQFDAVHQL